MFGSGAPFLSLWRASWNQNISKHYHNNRWKSVFDFNLIDYIAIYFDKVIANHILRCDSSRPGGSLRASSVPRQQPLSYYVHFQEVFIGLSASICIRACPTGRAPSALTKAGCVIILWVSVEAKKVSWGSRLHGRT